MDLYQGFSISILVGRMVILMIKILTQLSLSELIEPFCLPDVAEDRDWPCLSPLSFPTLSWCCASADGHECDLMVVLWEWPHGCTLENFFQGLRISSSSHLTPVNVIDCFHQKYSASYTRSDRVINRVIAAYYKILFKMQLGVWEGGLFQCLVLTYVFSFYN